MDESGITTVQYQIK